MTIDTDSIHEIYTTISAVKGDGMVAYVSYVVLLHLMGLTAHATLSPERKATDPKVQEMYASFSKLSAGTHAMLRKALDVPPGDAADAHTFAKQILARYGVCVKNLK